MSNATARTPSEIAHIIEAGEAHAPFSGDEIRSAVDAGVIYVSFDTTRRRDGSFRTRNVRLAVWPPA